MKKSRLQSVPFTAWSKKAHIAEPLQQRELTKFHAILSQVSVCTLSCFHKERFREKIKKKRREAVSATASAALGEVQIQHLVNWASSPVAPKEVAVGRLQRVEWRIA